MNDYNLCVIIPVHKPNLSEDDQISLKACFEKLNQFASFLIYPEGMDVSQYLLIHPQLLLKSVDPLWLASIEGYNKMKLNIDFYNMFKQYQYMLTYELDAYIFDSNICNSEYLNCDYIGAPYFEGYLNAAPNSPIIEGENSGFSIRNIQSCIYVLESIEHYNFEWKLYKHIFSKSRILRSALNRLTRRRFEALIYGQMSFHFSNEHFNEDMVWSRTIPHIFPKFKIADTKTAIKFSFEVNPDVLYEMNNHQLPAGCHAWPKFRSFWKDYIPELSNN